MGDALLTEEDRKEALSRAYVYAVMARAGYVTAGEIRARDAEKVAGVVA